MNQREVSAGPQVTLKPEALCSHGVSKDLSGIRVYKSKTNRKRTQNFRDKPDMLRSTQTLSQHCTGCCEDRKHGVCGLEESGELPGRQKYCPYKT